MMQYPGEIVIRADKRKYLEVPNDSPELNKIEMWLVEWNEVHGNRITLTSTLWHKPTTTMITSFQILYDKLKRQGKKPLIVASHFSSI
jgi:hypothetical protein